MHLVEEHRIYLDQPIAKMLSQRYGVAFSKEGWVSGIQNYLIQNYLICFPQSGTCMILLTNSNNGALAFLPLLKKLIGDNVTPWEWMRFTRNNILHDNEHTHWK